MPGKRIKGCDGQNRKGFKIEVRLELGMGWIAVFCK